MIIRSDEQKSMLREGGKRLSDIREELARFAAPGVRTDEIDSYAHQLMVEQGDTPAFLHYQPQGAPRPFPASTCISINEVIVHGIPTENPKTLKEGDVVSIDLGLVHNGLITDTTETVILGDAEERVHELVSTVRRALDIAIESVHAGVRTGTISAAIEQMIRSRGFGAPSEFGGHGVGMSVHEDPLVPNVGVPGTGAALVEGMVIAIEPIATLGNEQVVFDSDGYTARTKDGSPAAQVEHTVLVTKTGCEILTR